MHRLCDQVYEALVDDSGRCLGVDRMTTHARRVYDSMRGHVKAISETTENLAPMWAGLNKVEDPRSFVIAFRRYFEYMWT